MARRHAAEVFALVAGFVHSQVLLACVQLKLFDVLAPGPLHLDALADAIGLGRDGTERLVAAASSLELVDRRPGDVVALGRLGAPLVANSAITAMISHHATLYDDLTDPVALLRRTGRPSMASYWPYATAEGGASPAALPAERVAEYSALMSASQPLVTQEVLGAYRFSRHQVLLDVGAGEGSFVAAVAQQAPGLRFQLFDLPAVADRARQHLREAGLAERAQVFGGDFFADELPRGADAVSLVRVCFDHSDERVLRLLQAVRRALPTGGTVLLAEPMAAAAGAQAAGDAYFGFYLLAMGRGRSRSAQQLSWLLQQAGFDHVRQIPTRMPLMTGLLVASCRGT